MNSMIPVFCFTCASGVALCLYGDARHKQGLLGFGKMVASCSFLLLALASPTASPASPFGDPYRIGMTLALTASFVGDAFLIGRSQFAFLGGLSAFLIAHLLFAWAALSMLPQLHILGYLTGGVALMIGGGVLWWLKAFVPRALWWPSVVYMTVISVMVACCIQLSYEQKMPLIALAAIGFWLSDLSVARDRFQHVGFGNRLWGIPLYFSSQILFGLSLYPL